MKRIQALILLLAATGGAFAQAASEHAAATVAHLQAGMLNPSSFVLERVFVTKPDKRGNVSLCYEYRSQNVSGGTSAGRAVEDGGDHGRLSTFVVTGRDGQSADDLQGYNAGWVAPCKAKNIDHDITQDVALHAGTK